MDIEISETAEGVTNFLKALATMTESIHELPDGWSYVSYERFVLERGVWHEAAPLPDEIRRGELGNCFANALRLANSHRHLTYVEGYASSEFMPVQHAWCVDVDGTVIDPTWDDPQDRVYLGVEIDTDRAWEIVTKAKVFGIIGNDWMNGNMILRTGEI